MVRIQQTIVEHVFGHHEVVGIPERVEALFPRPLEVVPAVPAFRDGLDPASRPEISGHLGALGELPCSAMADGIEAGRWTAAGSSTLR